MNPFRYRGYYLDTETNLYYLQSRYYDSYVGRFINADDVGNLGIGDELLSYSLFSYCANNPVMNVDPEGEFFFTLIGAVTGGLIGAVSALIEGKSGREVWASAANGAVSGAIAGLATDIIAVTGGSALAVIAVGAAFGAAGAFAGSLTESAINQKDMHSGEVWSDAWTSAAFGLVFGAAGGAVSGPSSSMMQTIKSKVGKRTLEKGIKVGYAVARTMKNEVRHLVSNIAQEGLTDVTSWYVQKGVRHCYGW